MQPWPYNKCLMPYIKTHMLKLPHRNHYAVCYCSQTPSATRSDTSSDYEEAEHIYTVPKIQKKRLWQCRRWPTIARKSNPISRSTLNPDNSEADFYLTQKFRWALIPRPPKWNILLTRPPQDNILFTRPLSADTWNETTHSTRKNTNMFWTFNPSATANHQDIHHLISF